MLKNLIMSGFSPEHDVSGVVDPFLQGCPLAISLQFTVLFSANNPSSPNPWQK